MGKLQLRQITSEEHKIFKLNVSRYTPAATEPRKKLTLRYSEEI